MRLFTIYSILAVTWFQRRTIGYSDRVHLRLGIALQRDKQYLLEMATAELLTCQYPHAAVYNLFNLGRHLISAEHYRYFRRRAFASWNRAAAT